MERWLKRGASALLYALPVAFLALFFFYPLAAIFDLSLRPEGVLQWERLLDVVRSPYYQRTLRFTVWQATLSTALTIACALPCAYVFTRFQFAGKSTLLALATLPFVLPTVVVAAAFRALIWPNGLLNDGLMRLLLLDSPPLQLQRTLTAILIAHVFYNFAVALRMITGYWANQSTRMEEAAQVLGARGWRLWWYVRLPILRPAITAAALLVFIFTFTSFGVVLILGGFRYATLEVEIYYQAQSVFDLPVAAALSLVQIGAMFVMMAVYTRLQRDIKTDLQSTRRVARKPRNRREWLAVGATVTFIGGLLFSPLLALVSRSLSFSAERSTLHHYRNLLENRPVGGRLPRSMEDVLGVAPVEIIQNSLTFALMTTLAAVILGLLTSYLLARRGRSGRWLDPVFMLPLATSAVTLGFGYILTMDFNGVRGGLNDVFGLSVRGNWDLRASWILIPIAHVLVALPFVVRSVLPALRGIAPSIHEAAAVLGAPPHKRWLYVELPLISRGVIVGATFAFTISMGEFGASLFVARTESTTLPIAIERLLSQPGTSAEAYALSSLLLLVCATSFIVIERVRVAGIGEF
ncbi:MAG: iron ABC transporter permease [Anaerolineaceae bacterium]|nr:MAG: iron ABC transporter permease [Anaerolineaceae bacterium]